VLPQRVVTVLLALPLLILLVVSARYWIEFRKEGQRSAGKQNLPYNKFFTEEEMLIEQFGDEYVEYQRQVGMFFPKLF